MTSLLERLALAETAAAGKAAALREQLASAEEELRRLSITRETLLTLAAQDDERGDERGAEAAPGDPAPSARHHEDKPSDADEPVEAALLPVLRGVRRQTVALLATAQRPMRVRDVVVALGQSDERGKVESMRSRLLRLAADGWLVRCEGGTYAISSSVNGNAPSWEGGEIPAS
ncbi:hypothetical protein [Nonomuraea sp. NPDC048826]|uniref:hypothetical protein n=1 Tax=Nonomuraea sp. NPDC048826 TaxID=3364347 RepID=UPI00371AE451